MNEHDKMIVVVGTPSSGTSCVAGTLHHMGVDMGNISPNSTKRGYVSFECLDAQRFNWPDLPTEALVGAKDVHSYYQMRREKAGGQPFGWKTGGLFWLLNEDLKDLPIRIVRVVRPLEASMQSDNFHWAQTRNVEPSTIELIARGAQMGRFWMAIELLCNKIEPTVVVDFDDILNHPSMIHDEMAESLGLPMEAETRNKVVQFVDKNMVRF